MSFDDGAVLAALRSVSPERRREAAKSLAPHRCHACPGTLAALCVHPTHWQAAGRLADFAKACGVTGDSAPAPAPAPAPSAPGSGDPLAELRRLLADPDAARRATEAALAAVDSRLAALEASRGAPVFHVKIGEAPAVKVDGVAHSAMGRLLRVLSSRKGTAEKPRGYCHALLVGPAGCGKSYLAEQAAKALGLPFFEVSFSSGMSEGALVGVQIPGDGGRVVYVPSPVVESMEAGGLLFLDELDAADANVLLVLNAALASRRMTVHKRASKPRVEAADSWRVVAAANTWGHGADRRFVGRNELDESTLDRFRAGQIALDYDPNVEGAIVDAEVLEWGRAVRAHLTKESSRRSLSTRVLEDMTAQKAAGCPAAEWRAGFFMGWSADELARLPKGLK